MDLRITGTVKQVLEEQSGESKKGPWRKQEFILQTEGKYPKDVCILQWGDNIEQFAVQEGERLTAHVDVQSREFKGRWYTDVKAWRIEREGAAPDGAQGQPEPAGPSANFPEEPTDTTDYDDDLPF
ncbi:MAG: DUF3127 domain-containing protein [Gemmatimonadota bacterium]|nr:DUF3127 domain-containing protein [Gemmatimonadota bacterium]